MNITEYLESIDKRYRLGDSSEHTYRGDLENLIRGLVEGIEITNEPKIAGTGSKPDYVITKCNVPLGFMEAKDVGKNLNHINYEEQFNRYRKQFDNLIITDYIWFQFYQKGSMVHEIRIASIENKGIIPLSENFNRFSDLIVNFCTYISQTIKSPKHLAEMMAVKARLLQKEIEHTLVEDCQNESTACKSRIQGEYENFKEVLVHDLDVKNFSDIYAQTLAYGMFTARLHDESLDTFSRQEAASLIPKSNPFLRSLFDNIAGIDIDDGIINTVDNLADVFRATDIKSVLKNFGSATKTQDPIIHFYETFLAEYDPALRKSRGVWYTPEPVVSFIVRSVDEILKDKFKFTKGLADSSKVKITEKVQGAGVSSGKNKGKPIYREKEVHKVQVLDPATGTGTFLAEVFRFIYKSEFKNKKGAWGGYVKKDLIPRLNGFEILMASYAMAHLKLDMLLRDTGVELSSNQRLNIYLTNSLEKAHDDTGNIFSSELSREAKTADFIKRDTPVMVVLGNPPYSGISKNNRKWISDLINDYKFVDGEPLGERKHWLNDDYVKFIRYGQHCIDKNGEGVLAYINNHGFLDNTTFRGMRWHLLQSFDEIYVIDLHGNSLRHEVCPDGSPDTNVFDIMPGVSINFFIKTGKKKKDELAKVFHADFWGSRESKYERLMDNSLNSLKFKQVNYTKPYYFFVPKNDCGRAMYEQGFQVNALFSLNSVGFISANDGLNISYSKNEQVGKVNDLLDMEEHVWRVKYKRKEDSTTWTYLGAKQDAKMNFSNDKLLEVNYRPFDKRFTLYTGNSGGVYARPVRKIMQHFINNENIGLVTARQCASDWRYVFVTKLMGEFNLTGTAGRYGSGSYFPLYLYPEVTNQQAIGESSERKPNLDTAIVEAIAKCLGLAFVPEKVNDAATFAPIDLLDYIYAVLHSPSYRETYNEFLKIDFPRIPYPTDTDKFWQLVALGGELRQTHLLESAALDNHDITYPEGGDNIVTRNMTKSSIGYESTSDTHGKVWINDTQYFDNVPLVAWEFYIGGYQPAQKWLKERAKNNVDIVDDIDHYQRIIAALTQTHSIMQKIDGIRNII